MKFKKEEEEEKRGDKGYKRHCPRHVYLLSTAQTPHTRHLTLDIFWCKCLLLKPPQVLSGACAKHVNFLIKWVPVELANG